MTHTPIQIYIGFYGFHWFLCKILHRDTELINIPMVSMQFYAEFSIETNVSYSHLHRNQCFYAIYYIETIETSLFVSLGEEKKWEA